MVQAQHVPITAENVMQLGSVGELDFHDLPPEAGEIINGRVYINHDASLMAVVSRSSQIVILSDAFDLLHVSDVLLTDDNFPATFIDGSFGAGDSQVFAAVHTAGGSYTVSVMDTEGNTQTQRSVSGDQPVSIWLYGDQVWLELVPMEPGESPYLLQYDLPLGNFDPIRHPFAPDNDENQVVRIGRLPPPLAVTVTENGEVKRWNLQTGDLTATAQVAQIPIYGYATGNTLLWRDPSSSALHLLDFASGEDQVVVDLEGVYIPFIFLNPQADVVIGVHMDDEPVIAAWEVDTGNYHLLGLYRQCQRPPDMVRLSQDGSTLVIGCDAGLDVWRVRS